MISTEFAILRARRDLKISSLLNGVLVGGLLVAMVMPLAGFRFDAIFGLTAVGMLWFVLGLTSVKNSRLVANSPSLIATGQYEQAEQHIDTALRSFSIFRAVKLLSLHHLASLRHAQHRWRDVAMLCRALLSHRRVATQGIGRSTRLILADALLEMDDLRGVAECLADLYQQRLTLGEALSLMLVQLEYESRLGAWPSMIQGISTKTTLAELMPSAKSARTQALLALAAKKSGRSDWASWLTRRVELLTDPQELAAHRPLLRELWLT